MSQEELQRLAEPRTTYQEVIAMADEMLKIYGNPAPEIEARMTDGNGNIYKGTLYLVTDEKASEV